MNEPLRLHGYPVSNYFNIAHAALLEKGARFEVVSTRASQEEAFLAVSPMGKIPVLETPHGWLAETVAILEYLEDSLDGAALHATDAFQRARERQLINVVQMYVEVPARALFAGVFMGGANAPETIAAARITLDRAIGALRRLIDPRPFLMGDRLAHADLFAFYCLDIAERVSRFVYDRSIRAELGLDRWALRMAQRDSTRQVLREFDEAFAPYLAARNAAYQFQPTCYEAGSD
jgi:glutathione S-transferase